MRDRARPVFEDFDDTRAMIRLLLLEMKGCRVLEAVNGKEAWQTASLNAQRST